MQEYLKVRIAMKNNKTAVITGASRGIGRAVALRFAREGYQLGLCCKNRIEQLQETADLCRSLGANVYAVKTDVGNPTEIHSFFSEVKNQFGTVSVLINNAGISHIGLLTDMSNDDWNTMINTNLNSAFYTCREVIPGMVHEKSGHIINISSVWGNVGASCEVAYSTTKGGINAFTKALAKELAPSCISVNAVALGYFDTEMNSELTKEDKTELLTEIPAGRAGIPEEAADLVYSVASSSAYLTGQIITFDGGWC